MLSAAVSRSITAPSPPPCFANTIPSGVITCGPEAVTAIGQGATVLLHSGEAASHFAAECDRLGIARGIVRLAALAPRIAEAAGEGWRALAIAPQTRDRALLELARDMCH